MKKIVSYVWNDWDQDDRVKKKTLSLSKKYKVKVYSVCKGNKNFSKKINDNLDVEFISFKNSFFWFWNRLINNKNFWRKYVEKADIYDCNDPDTLEAGVMGKKKFNGKIVYDSHEYWRGIRRRESTFLYTLYSYIGNTIHYFRQEKLIHMTDRIITVSNSIFKIIKETYKKPTYLIMNISPKLNIDLDYEQKLKDKIIVFVGNKYRLGVESVLNYFKSEGYKVIVIGNAPKTNPDFEYTGFLEKEKFMKIISKALLGVVYTERTCKSIEYSMPNKLFEYIQAGIVPIVNIETIDTSDFVREHDIGFAINTLKYAIHSKIILSQSNVALRHFQDNIKLIRNKYTWEVQEPKLFEVYDFE